MLDNIYCDMLCDIFTEETGIPLIQPEFTFFETRSNHAPETEPDPPPATSGQPE